jgi:predicted dehydrogenase
VRRKQLSVELHSAGNLLAANATCTRAYATTRLRELPLKITVFGCGSIGSRHAKNISKIGGHDLWLYDTVLTNAEKLSVETGGKIATTIEEAFEASPDAVLVCTPPDTHIEIAKQALESGAHCFIEKPLAVEYVAASEITELAEQRGLVCMVGFNLRFHPGLVKIHQLIVEGSLGRIMMIRAEYGQYLPDWRPGSDYRNNYIANKSRGGGIIREESHEVDYVQWLAGPIEDIYVAAGQLSDLELEPEDSAIMIMRLTSGALAEVHVDCVQRGYSRKCKVIGTEGTAEWVYETGVTVTHAAGDVESIDISPEPNLMYFDEISHFIKCCAGTATVPVDGRSALTTMAVIDSAHRSVISHKSEQIL